MKMFPAAAFCILALFLTGCAGGGGSRGRGPADAGDYSNRMHSRFYKAWVQPETVGARRGKISVPVDVEIDPRGRVLSFTMAKPSGDPAVDASIAAVGERIKKVAPPPGKTSFKLRVYFELDVR